MQSSSPREESNINSTQPGSPNTALITSSTQRNLISLSSATVILSFFLPWVTFFGAKMTGMDIQKNFSSYQLVWLMPGLAGLTLLLNLMGQSTNLFRRLAGLCPFIILAYALNKMGSDLFKIVTIGGWLALIGGAALLVIPSEPKPTKPS